MLRKLKRHVLDWLFSGLDEEKINREDSGIMEEESQALEYSAAQVDAECIDTCVPPRRYIIRAGGMDFVADNYKFGPGGSSLDLIWTEWIDGKEKPIVASIFDPNFIIFDFETSVTPEVFENIKHSNLDFVNQPIEELKIQEASKKKAERNDKQRATPEKTGIISAYA